MGFNAATFNCDVCASTSEAKTTYAPPMGWFSLELVGPGVGIGGRRAYACSATCVHALMTDTSKALLMPAPAEAE